MSNMNENSLGSTMTFTRNILRNVYVWMTIAMGITALVAYGISLQGREALIQIFGSGLIWGILIAQIAMVFALSAFAMRLHPLAAVALFALYSMINGVSLSYIFVVYEFGSIVKAFVATAALFGAMSVYAIGTKRDLSGIGHFLKMALIGLVIAIVINIFLNSSLMDYVISIAGVLIFTGLTAYDTQKIKQLSDSHSGSVDESDYIRLSIVGALTLYLDFINIFLYLLRLFGSSRD